MNFDQYTPCKQQLLFMLIYDFTPHFSGVFTEIINWIIFYINRINILYLHLVIKSVDHECYFA